MKKIQQILFSAVFAAALLCPSDSTAWPFGGERKSLLKEARAKVEEADAARDEGRVMDEVVILGEAQGAYRRLASRYPDYKADEVAADYDAIEARMAGLVSRIRSGEIVISDPPSFDSAPGSITINEASQKESTAPDAPAAAAAPPELVRTSATRSSGKLVEEEREKSGFDSMPWMPDSDFPGGSSRLPKPSAAPKDRSESADGGSVKPAAAKPADSAPAADPRQPENETESAVAAAAKAAADAAKNDVVSKLPKEVRLRELMFAGMIQAGQSAEAVLLLEDVLSVEETPEMRFYFARALVECGNCRRAERELSTLPESWLSRPEVRSMRAAVAVALDKLPEATLQLDMLLREHPEWADAYINMAYVMFLSDPAKNRAAAAKYYEIALSRGAKRDQRLENELNVRFEE